MAHKRYRLLKRVARGRLGPIYRATDQAQDRAVLVRVISPTDSKGAMQAWALRALPPLQGLSHPALAGLWDVGVIAGEGSPFVALEPVEGVSLERSIWPEGYRFPRLMDPFVVVQVATQLATALAQLHAQGWAHGGVTPSNLFVAAGQGGAAQVKLLGLGNAQLRALARACGLRVASGDPRFAAPEPLASLQVGDARADLFQLGAVMHFMLTGWPPYPCDERDPRHMPTSEQVLGVLRGWPAGPGPRPSQWVPALKVFEGLDELVAELLAPRAQERPGDAYAVAVRLSEVLQARRPARALAMAKTQELEPVGAAPDPALTNP
jgi:serine/threonine-protein kinase